MTDFGNFFVFLTPLSRYWAIFLRLVQYPLSHFRSSSFPQSVLSFLADRRCSCIPIERFYGCTVYSGKDTSASLYCFFHITTLLCSRNTDILLRLQPSFYPPFFSYSTIFPIFIQLYCDITYNQINIPNWGYLFPSFQASMKISPVNSIKVIMMHCASPET